MTDIKEKVLKEKGYIQDFSMYGFTSSPFSDTDKPNLSKDFSKIEIKNSLTIGMYRIDMRNPEHSTMKFDLNKIMPKKENNVNQMRISLSKRDFNKLILPFLSEFGDELLAEVRKVIKGWAIKKGLKSKGMPNIAYEELMGGLGIK